ncbi:MAG: type II toxin-antitoxin system HicA family toxin [Candidatus Omnitrophica bacterium]|nr:type II toxin-antitoxin system HicA family toxin [Candidatus Omnitrophota bacterium]MBU3933234.1 type II toxin-antitoxin system HicA family toxin [Candidatus Omnitrophota bacterium]
MTALPSLKPSEAIRKLRKAGFVFDRHAKGSHEIWYNPNTRRRTVIPNHPGKDIPKGTLRAIIQQAGLAIEEFNGL